MPDSIAQQLKRIATKVAATSYIFPEEDATGFPNTLPPARKIGLGRRSLTGLMTSAVKAEGDGPFESSLERDFYVLLEFDPNVIRWYPQSVSVPGARASATVDYYFPDVLVGRQELGSGDDLVEFDLCEVKYRAQIKKDWRTLKPKFKACRAYAREHHWRFRIVTEVEIRTPRLFNAKFLLPYMAREAELGDQRRIYEQLDVMGETTPAKLLESLSDSMWERAAIMPSLWALVGTRAVVTDLDKKLTMQSSIRAHE
jgi:hypothetical protein